MKFDKVIVLGLQQLFMQLLDLCWGCSLFNIVTAGREKISLHESLLHHVQDCGPRGFVKALDARQQQQLG